MQMLKFPEIPNMEQCIREIPNRMYSNKLRLNDSKTEFLLVAKSSDIEKTNIRSLDIGEIKVSPCDLARNLGVIFDKELNMKCQIFYVSKVAHYHLRNIAKLKHHLPKETLEVLVHDYQLSHRLWELSVLWKSRFITSQTSSCAKLCSKNN